MQSTWRKIARETVLRWPCATRLVHAKPSFLSFSPRPNARFTIPTAQNRWIPLARAFSTLSTPRFFTATAPAPESEAPTVSESSTNDNEAPSIDTVQELTPQRHALVASQAIRYAVAEGNLPDAYLILNSLFYATSTLPTTSPLLHALSRLLPENAFQPTPIPFSPRTPTRLVTHTLVHSLLRAGYLSEASTLSESLIAHGERLHPRTLNALFATLTDPKNNPAPEPVPVSLRRLSVLAPRLAPEHLGTPGAQHALRLLNVAREARHRRTHTMYRTLMRLCILNGEIIVASLLFGMMVKDWNAQAAELACATAEGAMRQDPAYARYPAEDPRRKKERALGLPAPFPGGQELDMLTHAVRVRLDGKAIDGDGGGGDAHGAVQALANLAVLVDTQTLPIGNLSRLLLLLTEHSGRDWGEIWVPKAPTAQDEALGTSPDFEEKLPGRYFRHVLQRLCANLPDHHRPAHSFDHRLRETPGALPALCVKSYSALLTFATRRLGNWELTKAVMDHAAERRVPKLGPNAWFVEALRQASVVFNSGEAFQRAEEGAAALAARHTPLPATGWKPTRPVEAYTGTLATDPETFFVKHYASLLSDTQSPLLRDRLLFLISSGHSAEIKPYLRVLLPGYSPHDRPRVESWRAALGVDPGLVAAVLSGLHRAGMGQAAVGVWEWAQDVEAFSMLHGPDEIDTGTDTKTKQKKSNSPWALGIESYTTVLKALERTAALVCTRAHTRMRRSPKNTGRTVPYRYVERVLRRLRGDFAKVYKRVVACHKPTWRGRKTPQPDALFFNAALDAVYALEFGRRVPRSWSADALASEMARVEEAMREHRRVGKGRMPPMKGPVFLRRVGRDVQRWGWAIPPVYRKWFVGTRTDPHRNDNGEVRWAELHHLNTPRPGFWFGSKMAQLK